MGRSMESSKSIPDPRRFRSQNTGRIVGEWSCPAYSTAPEHLAFLARKRQFYLWRYTQGQFTHHALGLSYEMEVGDCSDEEGRVRFFKADIKVETVGEGHECVLRFEGPCKRDTEKPLDTRHYSKELECQFESTLHNVKETCEFEFRKFGTYNVLTNNCQHFVTKVIKALGVCSAEKLQKLDGQEQTLLRQRYVTNQTEVLRHLKLDLAKAKDWTKKQSKHEEVVAAREAEDFLEARIKKVDEKLKRMGLTVEEVDMETNDDLDIFQA